MTNSFGAVNALTLRFDLRAPPMAAALRTRSRRTTRLSRTSTGTITSRVNHSPKGATALGDGSESRGRRLSSWGKGPSATSSMVSTDNAAAASSAPKVATDAPRGAGLRSQTSSTVTWTSCATTASSTTPSSSG